MPQTIDGAGGVVQAGLWGPPVIPGLPVTGSAWVSGAGAFLLLQFFDSAGALLSGHSSQPARGDELERVSVSAVAPPLATTARISARQVSLFARPAITWTSEATPWGVGRGCPKAVIEADSHDLIRTGELTYETTTYTIREVG